MANKLRLEEEEDYNQGQKLDQQLSESAKAMRDNAVLQQMANPTQQQVQPAAFVAFCCYVTYNVM